MLRSFIRDIGIIYIYISLPTKFSFASCIYNSQPLYSDTLSFGYVSCFKNTEYPYSFHDPFVVTNGKNV